MTQFPGGYNIYHKKKKKKKKKKVDIPSTTYKYGNNIMPFAQYDINPMRAITPAPKTIWQQHLPRITRQQHQP